MNKLKFDVARSSRSHFGRQLEDGKHQAAMLSERFPFHSSANGSDMTESSASEFKEPEEGTSKGEDLDRGNARPLVIPIDLFG